MVRSFYTTGKRDRAAYSNRRSDRSYSTIQQPRSLNRTSEPRSRRAVSNTTCSPTNESEFLRSTSNTILTILTILTCLHIHPLHSDTASPNNLDFEIPSKTNPRHPYGWFINEKNGSIALDSTEVYEGRYSLRISRSTADSFSVASYTIHNDTISGNRLRIRGYIRTAAVAECPIPSIYFGMKQLSQNRSVVEPSKGLFWKTWHTSKCLASQARTKPEEYWTVTCIRAIFHSIL